MKKNILVCCPVYSPHAGGGGQYFPLLVSQLLSLDSIKNVIVLTEKHPDKTYYEVEHNAHIYRLLPQRDTKINKTKIYSLISFFITYTLFYLLLPALIARHRIGVIHYTRYLRAPFYFLMSIFKNLFRVKIILDMRTTVESDISIKKLFGFSSMISNSIGVYDQMCKLGVDKEKNFFVPNPIEFPKKLPPEEASKIVKELGVDLNTPYLLFVGQLLERKSIIEVIDAFNVFNTEHQSFKLILVGRNMIGKLIEDRLIENENIKHIQPIERRKVIALMQYSEIILQPSKVEGIPRVSLEALSLGKKVLLPPCVPEFVANNSIFSINKVTSSEIKDAIFRIYKTSKLPEYDLSVHNPAESIKALSIVYKNTSVVK